MFANGWVYEKVCYCFKHYSSFEDIKDEEFHRLRTNYLKSANDLEEYIKNKYNEEVGGE
jgi:hypothetical protein